MHPFLLAEYTVSTAFVVLAVLAIVAQAIVIFVALFDGGPRYKVSAPSSDSLESDGFLYMLEALTDSKVNRHTTLEVLTNGENFYDAELQAIAAAQSTINLEAYIFHRGDVAGRYVQALAERARAGVKVNVLFDGLGSSTTTESYLKPLRDAGGRVGWYHALRWNTLPRYNNRSHRELLIVDGKTGFIGGAGIADQWLHDQKKSRRWRDTMVRVQGDAVPNLQATFAENWLESCGEILTGPEYFPICDKQQGGAVLVVNSTPSGGGSTRARMLMQLLVASAKRSILITTPYFLPDSSMSDALVQAARERGVEVKIVVPGPHADHLLTRSSGRRAYGKLLRAGARVYEYQPSMLHAKILTIDSTWGVVGSTNFDHRSFGINDEVNLAACDRPFAARLERDFHRDVAESREITLREWNRRSLLERAPELLGWVFERQQ
jgi:cardiolipin synthase A/B